MGFAGAEMEFRGQRWVWTGRSVSYKDVLWEQRRNLRTEMELGWRKTGSEEIQGARDTFRG